MMSTLTKMHSDTDRDVVEAVETCDFKLLQIKKKTREQEKAAAAVDAQRLLLEQTLQQREAKVSTRRPLLLGRRGTQEA